jgi:hypothetical protein
MGRREAGLGLAVLLALPACGSSSTAGAGRTERERDSVIGQSKLPGAHGVQGALQAGDSARARAAALDSLADP